MRTVTKRKAVYELLQGILESARNGQTLSICTIFLLLHSTLHVIVSLNRMFFDYSMTFLHQLSYTIIMLNFSINIIGYVLLIKLYKHSIRHIFNREIPSTIMECIPSFCAHISLLRPLEIIFRYCTYRWRVLPDVIVLGEVRCGTTSLCQHFALLRRSNNNNDWNTIDCHTPFCLWAHPELDHKESFFFVGHYLGYVTPEAYRMCFPLKITKWFSEKKWKWVNSYNYYFRGKKSSTTIPPSIFMTFDGCAQYLTSPTASALIAEAYRAADQPPPVLIACVREPIDQARSWWRYENNAMIWGESMSLREYNTDLRGEHYPPISSDDALGFSRNCTTINLYKRAEYLFSQNTLKQATERKVPVILPNWAMTWPGGQLAGIGRNALFVENIMRYEKIFQLVFSSRDNKTNQQKQQDENINIEKKLEYVNIMPMKYLSNETLLRSFLFDILKKVSKREVRHYNGNDKENVDHEKLFHIFMFEKNIITTGVHRNAAVVVKHDENSTNSKHERFSKESEDFFQVEKEKLLSLCQVNTPLYAKR